MEISHRGYTPTWDISLSLKKYAIKLMLFSISMKKMELPLERILFVNLRDLQENWGQKRPLGQKVGIWSNKKIVFCCYNFYNLVWEKFLWAMEKVFPEVEYGKKWSRAKLETTFFRTRLLDKLFPLPTKRFRALKVVKIYSNRIFFRTFLFFHMEHSIKHSHNVM